LSLASYANFCLPLGSLRGPSPAVFSAGETSLRGAPFKAESEEEEESSKERRKKRRRKGSALSDHYPPPYLLAGLFARPDRGPFAL